jgi:hypothetical protein
LEDFGLRGKEWSDDEVRQLSQFLLEGKSLNEISAIMGKTRVSVKAKLHNLGLSSVQVATGVQGTVAAASAASSPPVASTTPTSVSAPEFVSAPTAQPVLNVVGVDLKLPERLPNVEETLKIMYAALEALTKPCLSRSEQTRLHYIIEGAKKYQEYFAKYVDYCGLEVEVLELRRKLAEENAKGSS